MTNKFILLLVGVFMTLSLSAQTWRFELEKHKDKPVNEIIQKMEQFFDNIGPTKENKYHHWKRWRNHAINHQNGDGYLFNYQEKNASLLKKLEKRISEQKTSDNRHFHGQWESVNPQNFQNPNDDIPNMGRINCIAIPPSNGNIIYAGAATGGIWKSYNHGASWIPLWDGMLQMGVSDIVIDYTNENHIIALTGDADASNIPSTGLYHSYDGGYNWSAASTFSASSSIYGYKLVQSKSNSDHYYMAAKGTINAMYRIDFSTYPVTYDVQGSPTSTTAFDIEYLTGSSSILFASTRNGLYKKTGTGDWNLHNVSGLPTGTFSRTAIAMAPSNPDVIYYMVATQSDPIFYGIYKSDNGGNSFAPVYDTSDPNKLTTQASYNFCLAVDPTDEDKIFVGTVSFYKSDDGGNTLSGDSTMLHADNHNTYFFNNNQYVCTDGGLSYRPIGNTDFIGINNGMITTQFYKIDVNVNKIVGGTQDNGTLFWKDGDAVGIKKTSNDGFDCIYDPSNTNTVFTTTQDNTFRSTNNGDNITWVLPNRWAAPISFWPNDTKRVISFDKENLRVSYDNGVTWPDNLDIFFDSTQLISGFSQCASSTNTAYACNFNQVVRSDNFNNPSTSTWTTYTEGIDSTLDIRNILVNPNNSGEVYVTTSGYAGTQIYKSTNGGNDWNPFDEGLDEIPVYCIYYDHVNGDGFYIGTEFGVFYRNSTMSEWIPFSTQLPRIIVTDLNITDTHVYAGTFGRGVWRSERYQPCKSNLILFTDNDPTDGLPSGRQIYKASNIIVSNRTIQGGAGSDVLYQAGNYIELTEGFYARRNNLFVAKAAGCLE